MNENNRTFHILGIFSKLVYVILLTVLLSGLQLPPVVHAATVTVDITNDELDGADSGACTSANIADYDGDGGVLSDISLREAICWANASAGADIITLAAGSTYILSIAGTGEDTNATGDLDITDTSGLTIQSDTAGSKAIIDANDIDRVINLPDAGGPLTLVDIVVQNGTADAASSDDGGGGILVKRGDLTLTQVTITDNVVIGDTGADGGGLAVDYDDANVDGTVIIIDSTISNNTSIDHAGGAYFDADPTGTLTVTISGSTISGNQLSAASNDGGGIFLTCDSDEIVDFTMTNSTVSGNTATDEGGGMFWTSTFCDVNISYSTIANNTAGGNGGGIHAPVSGTLLDVFASILADNTTTGGIGPDCNGTITSSAGHILVEDTTNCTLSGTTTGNLTGDPGLAALADNGGPTETHAIGGSSTALDTIASGTANCGGSITVDQRGATRPSDGDANGTASCDMGAFELGALRCNIQSATEPTTYTFFGDVVGIEVTDDGTNLDCLRATDIPHNHPNATGIIGGSGTMTGRYWILEGLQSDQSTAATENFSLNLTLAHNVSPDSNANVCKYPGGLGGYGWDCSRTGSTVSTVWRNGISSLSDWAVGDNVGPTALTLRGLSTQSRVGLYGGALAVALLVLAVSGLALVRRRSKPRA